MAAPLDLRSLQAEGTFRRTVMRNFELLTEENEGLRQDLARVRREVTALRDIVDHLDV